VRPCPSFPGVWPCLKTSAFRLTSWGVWSVWRRFYLIARMAVKMLIMGKVEKDVRSDDEDGEEVEHVSKKKD
jgi:hypothetical protein